VVGDSVLEDEAPDVALGDVDPGGGTVRNFV
jgi:hypothetical protein